MERHACTKNVLLVVRICGSYNSNKQQQLDWLEKNVFPLTEYGFGRYLFVYGDPLTTSRLFPDWWTVCEWNDLYTKLMLGSFLDDDEAFQFALLVTLANDNHAGMGYGREETRPERCILRAMTLASRGNVLFGEWGFPNECQLGTTHSFLQSKYVLNSYLYVETMNKMSLASETSDGCRLEMNTPFILFLDHYLDPISKKDVKLSDESMRRIQECIQCSYFSQSQLDQAERNAYFQLYFARDEQFVEYHQWKNGRQLQRWSVDIYFFCRRYVASSSIVELCLDGSILVVCMLFSHTMTSMTAFLVWFVFVDCAAIVLTRPYWNARPSKMDICKHLIRITVGSVVFHSIGTLWIMAFPLEHPSRLLSYCFVLKAWDQLCSRFLKTSMRQWSGKRDWKYLLASVTGGLALSNASESFTYCVYIGVPTTVTYMVMRQTKGNSLLSFVVVPNLVSVILVILVLLH